MHFHLRSKHVRYEIEGFPGVEHFIFRHELVFFDELQVEDVIDEAEEQVDLGDDDLDEMHSLRRDVLVQEALEQHERTGQGRPELMRNRHLIVHDGLVSVLLLEHLALQLQGLNMLRHVIKVDSGGLLLEELDAFHPDLSEPILAAS